MNIRHASSALTLSILLASCGGSGGGVASTPTPVPTPTPTPTNSTLTDLKADQSFTNDAAAQTASYDLTTNTGISGTAAKTGLTISYSAANQSYTLTAGGRSQTFLPADIKSSASGETKYQKSDSAASDYLTLLSQPYTSAQKLQYVGLGYWQTNKVSGSQQDMQFDVFTYGLPSAGSAVPATGTAHYAIDTFGLISAPGQEPRSFTGSGGFDVDFAAGVFAAFSYVSELQLVSGGGTSGGGIDMTATGQLGSGDGKFSGLALYEGSYGSAAGELSGRFYGPTAQELGATFAATNAAGMSVSGAFTGQDSNTAASQNLTLTNLRMQQLFYTQYAYGTGGQLNWQNAETFTFGTPTSDLNSGQFTINDKVTSADPNFNAWRKTIDNTSNGSQDITLALYKPGPTNTELALTYATFGHWATTLTNGTGNHPIDLWFAYGLPTPRGLIGGRTGSAHYAGVAYGTSVSSPDGKTYAVKGTSSFDVDFSAQSLSGVLAMTGTPGDGSTAIDFGSYGFAGALSSYVATTDTPITRGGTNVGQISTQFYGPNGNEIAGPFSLTAPAGAPGAGISIGGVAAAAGK